MSRARRTAGASSLTLSNPSEESLVPLFKQWNETELRIFFEGKIALVLILISSLLERVRERERERT
jgi:hypothetical protein